MRLRERMMYSSAMRTQPGALRPTPSTSATSANPPASATSAQSPTSTSLGSSLTRAIGRRSVAYEDALAPGSPHGGLVSQSEGVLHRRWRWDTQTLKLPALDRPLSLPKAQRARQDLFTLAPSMPPQALGQGPVVYIDGESTGLGGASNRFCVIGIVYATAQAWICEQWVLAKLSYEPQFLSAITQRLDALDPCAIVSFNGASFDLPLFRKRLAAARNHPELRRWQGFDRTHGTRCFVDLVHSARRVFKGRVPDCKLQTLERHFLGVHRLHDLPGKDVPQVYWAWLKRRKEQEQAERMEQVLVHNLVDLAVMPALAHRIAQILADPRDGQDALRALCHSERAPSHPIFLRAMHRWLQAGRPGAHTLREPRLQVWIRALEAQCAPQAPASPPLRELLQLALQRFPSSIWVFRRARRWGLLPVASAIPAASPARASPGQLGLGL